MTKAINRFKKSFEITEDWPLQVNKLKLKYPQLSDSDLRFEFGKEEELLRRIEFKLNKSRQEIIDIIYREAPRKLGF